MSNGMYCSASQWIESASSASVITGNAIFLTITALPDSEATTSFALKRLVSKMRRIASATVTASMTAPSTIVSGGIDSDAQGTTLKTLDPFGFNSMALTALDPMSRPTTGFGERRKLNSNRKGRASAVEFGKAGATAVEAATDATVPRQNWDQARGTPLESD